MPESLARKISLSFIPIIFAEGYIGLYSWKTNNFNPPLFQE